MQLRTTMRVNEDEATRKAAYEGLRGVGPFVAEPFLKIVKDRNRLAKKLGFACFYDMKASKGVGLGVRKRGKRPTGSLQRRSPTILRRQLGMRSQPV